MINLRKYYILASGIACLLGTSQAIAACSSTLTTVPVVQLPLTDIPRDLPIGSLIYQGIMTTSVNVSANTGGSFNLQARSPKYGKNAMTYNSLLVFNTSLRGVGIAFNGYAGGNGFDIDTRPGRFTGTITKNTDYYVVKTGTIQGGNLTTTVLGLYYNCAGVNDSSPYNNDIQTRGGPITVKTCTVNNANISFSLDDAPEGTFKQVGTTYGDKEFKVSLNCDVQTKIVVSMNGSTDGSGSPGVVSSAATPGIGVQFLHNSTPLTLGQPVKLADGSPGQNLEIPLTARYYQTKNDYKAGKVDATATLTMTYQ